MPLHGSCFKPKVALVLELLASGPFKCLTLHPSHNFKRVLGQFFCHVLFSKDATNCMVAIAICLLFGFLSKSSKLATYLVAYSLCQQMYQLPSTSPKVTYTASASVFCNVLMIFIAVLSSFKIHQLVGHSS